MIYVTAIVAVIQLAAQLLSLLVKTPADQIAAKQDAIKQFLLSLDEGIKNAQATQGDTSAIEEQINKH